MNTSHNHKKSTHILITQSFNLTIIYLITTTKIPLNLTNLPAAEAAQPARPASPDCGGRATTHQLASSAHPASPSCGAAPLACPASPDHEGHATSPRHRLSMHLPVAEITPPARPAPPDRGGRAAGSPPASRAPYRGDR
jgi:hypothetical protein